jgi:DNA-binding transcriptional regulator YiaG
MIKKSRKALIAGVSATPGARTKKVSPGLPAMQRKRPTAARDLAIVADDRGRALLGLRSRLKLSREVFARLVPMSTRSLASIEAGKTPAAGVQRKLLEVQRVVEALSEVIAADAIGPWMLAPNDAFDGLKPLEVIERGEVDRLWRMIFLLRSGVPF